MTTNNHANVPAVQDERMGLSSASVAEREFHCPGSRQAAKYAPPLAAQAITIEGQDIHEALEKDDFSGLADDQREIAEQLKALGLRAFAEWHETVPNKRGTIDRAEERLWFRDPKGKPIMSAKLDKYWVAGSHAIVVDWKSGFLSPTPSAKNFQLRVQALSLAQAYPAVQHIRVATAHYRIRPAYDPCDYTKDDLAYAGQEVLLVNWRADQEDAPRSAGEWCRYCPAKAFCKDAAVFALLNQTVAASIAEKVEQLPLEALAFIESRRKLSETIFEAVKERLKTFGAADLETVGLAKTKDARVGNIEDAGKAMQILVDAKLLTVEEFWTCIKVALGNVEKIVLPRYAETHGCSEKAAQPLVRDILAPAMSYGFMSGRLIQFKPLKQIN